MRFKICDKVQTLLPGPTMLVTEWSMDGSIPQYKCLWWNDSSCEERWFREDVLIPAPEERRIGLTPDG